MNYVCAFSQSESGKIFWMNNKMIYFHTQTLTSPSLPPPQFALCHIPYNNHRISFLLGPLSQMNVSSFEDWPASLRKLWLRHTSSCLMSSREIGEFCGICYVLPRLTRLQRKTLGRMRNHSLRLCRWGCKSLGEDVNEETPFFNAPMAVAYPS